MTKALISIDYSYDFVADDGKLTAGKPAQAIEDRIAQVTQEAYDNGDYIFVAMDRHDEGDTFHPETKLFPPHNIAGTSGRELYGKLAGVYDAIKDDHRVFWMDKRHYSASSFSAIFEIKRASIWCPGSIAKRPLVIISCPVW